MAPRRLRRRRLARPLLRPHLSNTHPDNPGAADWVVYLYISLAVGDVILGLMWLIFGGSKAERAATKERARVYQTNYQRLLAEATARLDPVNQNANARGQILSQLVNKYFPPWTLFDVDHWTGFDLGWQRPASDSPWEPVIELFPCERERVSSF